MTELEQLQQNVSNAQQSLNAAIEKYEQSKSAAISILSALQTCCSDSVNGFANRSFNDTLGLLQAVGPSCNTQSCKDNVASYNTLLQAYKNDKNSADGVLTNNLNSAKQALAAYIQSNPIPRPIEHIQNAGYNQSFFNPKAFGKFIIMFIIGFAIGMFVFRNRENKIWPSVAFGFGLPVLLYLTIGRIGMWSAPPPASVQNFFATYGFGNFETSRK